MDPVLLRALERILVVLFSGMSIYLGYRLFLAVKPYTDSAGKVTLPGGVQVVMTRVGPGAFFALFGTITLAMSLFYRVEAGPTARVAGDERLADTYDYVGVAPGAAEAADGQALTRVTGLLYTLNGLEAQLRPDLPDATVARIRRDLRQTRLRLLRGVWAGDWGDYRGFADWVEYENAAGRPPQGYDEPARLLRQGLEP